MEMKFGRPCTGGLWLTVTKKKCTCERINGTQIKGKENTQRKEKSVEDGNKRATQTTYNNKETAVHYQAMKKNNTTSTYETHNNLQFLRNCPGVYCTMCSTRVSTPIHDPWGGEQPKHSLIRYILPFQDSPLARREDIVQQLPCLDTPSGWSDMA